MTKPLILFTELTGPTGLMAPWIKSQFEQYFDLAMYNSEIDYPVDSTILCVNSVQYDSLYTEFAQRGYRVMVDNLWERANCYRRIYPNHSGLVLHNCNWFWYNESLWYRSLGLHQYQPARTYEKLAFMPMRLRRPHRDSLIRALKPTLDRCIWSYVAQGRRLPKDHPGEVIANQRYFNPDWYDATSFSIVAETSVTPTVAQPVFITEKSFKPMAFQHPFIVYGDPGTLNYLHSLKFETFDNLFDESYDNEPKAGNRLKLIVDNILSYQEQTYSNITQERIEYNYNRFFDEKLVHEKIQKEIIEPILEYVNS
jgi:hypothetical protein